MNFLQTSVAMALLDSVSSAKPAAVTADQVLDSAAEYASRDIAVQAAAAVQTWVETDDLDEGEGPGDRLVNMLIGTVDADKDGELSDDEQGMLAVAMEKAWGYLASKGADEADLDLLFNSEDPAEYNAAGGRIMELMADSLPDGDEASISDMDAYAFGGDASDPVFDSACLDAVYKNKVVVRGGRKMRVRKRVAGTVRLTAKQKMAVRKMHTKSHGSKARMMRMKSMKIRGRMGL